MKAYAMLEIGKTGWIEKEVEKCGPMDAICKPIAIAPCTSDVHTVWEGAMGDKYNLTLGHECAAEVVEVGEMVEDFKPGDRVIVPAITPDWHKIESQAGYSTHGGGMLAGWKFSNIKDGVFAELFHVNCADGNLAHLPEGMDAGDACMLADMVPTGFHGAELANIQYGDQVLVIGIGPVGLMAVAAANMSGASRIIAVGTRQLCIDVAKDYGATDFISYKNGPIADQVLEMTNGKGVDRVIVAGGDVDTFIDAVRVVKPGGNIANVNYLGSGEFIKIPRVEWGAGMAHKSINGGLMFGGRLRMEKYADLIKYNKLDVSKLITHKFYNFDDIEEALFMMKDKPADLIKPVIYLE